MGAIGRFSLEIAGFLSASLFVFTGSSPGVAQVAAVLDVKSNQTKTDKIIYRRSSYNYAPSLIHDGLIYHLYWCAGIAGDYILHAQSTSVDGPWHSANGPTPNSFDISLSPTKSADDFDGLHTCDPNVIKVGSKFFLFYSGESKEGALTAIGVAASADAVHFERQNQGKPIVVSSATNPNYLKPPALTYGAGQPAATFIDPYVYLSFTDSTASGANRVNGAGQFALRSKDPRFQEVACCRFGRHRPKLTRLAVRTQRG